MFNRISQNSMNTPLAEGILMGKSLRQPAEDYFIFFINRTQVTRGNSPKYMQWRL